MIRRPLGVGPAKAGPRARGGRPPAAAAELVTGTVTPGRSLITVTVTVQSDWHQRDYLRTTCHHSPGPHCSEQYPGVQHR
jgi:hypothetical protein